METNKLSGIVVYTIHDNPTLRDAIREALKLKMQAYEIDESTYGVPIPGILLEQVKKLKKICEDVAKEVKNNYRNNDYVSLYVPTYSEESGDNRYIKRVIIIGE